MSHTPIEAMVIRYKVMIIFRGTKIIMERNIFIQQKQNYCLGSSSRYSENAWQQGYSYKGLDAFQYSKEAPIACKLYKK